MAIKTVGDINPQKPSPISTILMFNTIMSAYNAEYTSDTWFTSAMAGELDDRFYYENDERPLSSPFVKRMSILFADSWITDNVDSNVTYFAHMIVARFGKSWHDINSDLNQTYDMMSTSDVTDTTGGKATTSDAVYAFNSAAKTPSSESTGENSGQSIRKGREGRSAQEMIREEMSLRKIKISDTIFDDAMSVLCRNVYIQ